MNTKDDSQSKEGVRPMNASEKDEQAERPIKLAAMPSYLLNRISHRYNQTVQAELKAIGLTTLKMRIIVSLKVYDELSVNELCVHAIAEQPTMSRAIDRMVEQGLVSREVSHQDSRARVMRLTPQGEALYDRIMPVMQKANSDLLDGLPEENRAEFLQMLVSVLKNIRKNPF